MNSESVPFLISGRGMCHCLACFCQRRLHSSLPGSLGRIVRSQIEWFDIIVLRNLKILSICDCEFCLFLKQNDCVNTWN